MEHTTRKKIPTTIISGFLGSGKTTIISHLVDWLIDQKEKVAYIKNEIGSVDVDGKLLQGKNIQTKELLNGCICCTLVGPFLDSIQELVDTVHPTRILIEASGASKPDALALMVQSNPLLLRDAVITIIDVVNFEGYKDLSFTARKQAEFTDLIVFNKIELANLERKRAVVGYVRELNQDAPIVEAPNGILDPLVAFGTHNLSHTSIPHHTEHSDHPHLEEDNISTFSLHLAPEISQDNLEKFLHELPKNIIRVKGFASTRTQKMLINKVGTRVQIEETPLSEAPQLVFIGFYLSDIRQPVTEKAQKFHLLP